MKCKFVATIEARMTSSRLPGKVLMEYQGKTNLEHIVNRVSKSKYIDEIVVATTINDTDDPIVDLCKRIGCKYYRGSEDDVLLRVLDAAKSVEAQFIVEITGDAPLVDWRIIDKVIEEFNDAGVDYVANMLEKSYPMGFEVQVFSVDTLNQVNALTKSPVDHEHVSLYIYTHPEIFSIKNVTAEKALNYSELQFTLDTADDYKLISRIYDELYPLNRDFSAIEVIELVKSNDEVLNMAMAKTRKNPFEEQKKWLDEYGE